MFNREEQRLTQKQQQVDAVCQVALLSDIELKLKLIEAYLLALQNNYPDVSTETLLPIAADLAKSSPIANGVPVIKSNSRKK